MLHFEWVCCFRWFLFILYSFFIRCLSIPLFVYRLVLYLSEIEYVRVTIFMSCFLFPVSPRFFLGMYYVVCVCVFNFLSTEHTEHPSIFLICNKVSEIFTEGERKSSNRKKRVHFYLSPSSHWFENRLYCILIAFGHESKCSNDVMRLLELRY